MEDFTRDILDAAMDILVAEGHLDDEAATGFIADVDGDPDVTLLFNTIIEQARLFGFEQGYDEGYDEGVDSNTGWDEDEDEE